MYGILQYKSIDLYVNIAEIAADQSRYAFFFYTLRWLRPSSNKVDTYKLLFFKFYLFVAVVSRPGLQIYFTSSMLPDFWFGFDYLHSMSPVEETAVTSMELST